MAKLFGRECSREQAVTVETVTAFHESNNTLEHELRSMRKDCQNQADNHGSAMNDKEYLSLINKIDSYTRYIDFLVAS